MADDDGRPATLPSFLDDRLSEGLVDRYVARIPGVVDAGVHVGIVRWIPHIVLKEP